MKTILIFITQVMLMLLLSSCRETFFFNSEEIKLDSSKKNFTVTEEEKEAIWQKIKTRLENGEDLDGTSRALLKMVQSKLAAQNPLKTFTLSDANRSALENKYQKYMGLVPSRLNSFGFVDGCDGLLFTSLLNASGYRTNLAAAESKAEPGKWYRDAQKDCFTRGESKSTISRDMMLGLAVALWQAQSKEQVEDILLYAEAHGGVIGEAANTEELYGRAFFSPQMYGMYYELQLRLGGLDNDKRGFVPEFSATLTGFEAHLQALRMLLRGQMIGGLIKEDISILQGKVAKNPNNALFQMLLAAFTTGDMNATAQILLNTQYFPAERLPTAADRCEPYLWQRDEGTSDWQPCPEKSLQHPGVDFFLPAAFVLEKLRMTKP